MVLLNTPSTAEPQPPAETPKGMRELLFAGLLASLEDAIEREHPAYAEHEYKVDPDWNKRSGSPYWQAWHRIGGMRSVLYLVKSALITHEEYLIADRQRISSSWSEGEMACARHLDVCPRCTETSQQAWKVEREVERAEHAADLYVSGISQIRLAIARAAGSGEELTAAQIDKVLGRLLDSAKRKQGGGHRG